MIVAFASARAGGMVLLVDAAVDSDAGGSDFLHPAPASTTTADTATTSKRAGAAILIVTFSRIIYRSAN